MYIKKRNKIKYLKNLINLMNNKMMMMKQIVKLR